MMRKTLLAFGCATAAMVVAGPVSAANVIFNITAPSGTFTSNEVACDTGAAHCAGNFTATGTFDMPSGFDFVQGTITTNAISPMTNIDFSSVTLNGRAFELTSLQNGKFEFGSLDAIPLLASNTLVVSGFTGGRASFAGDLTFAPGAVPEPATWGMMLLGFAGVGSIARRRKMQVRTALQMA